MDQKDDQPTPSLGKPPEDVMVSPRGDVSEVPPAGEDVKEGYAAAVDKAEADVATGLKDPAKDETLISGLKSQGQLLRLRYQEHIPETTVAHPPNGDTLLEPAVEAMATSLEAKPAVMQYTGLKPASLRDTLAILRHARALYGVFKPIVDDLDAVIASLQDDLNTQVRAGYKRVSSVVLADPTLKELMAAVTTLIVASATKALHTKRAKAQGGKQPRQPGHTGDTPAPETPPAGTGTSTGSGPPVTTVGPGLVGPGGSAAVQQAGKGKGRRNRRGKNKRR